MENQNVEQGTQQRNNHGFNFTNRAHLGFLPAFQDRETGETHLSLNAKGAISPIHLLDGLPEEWVEERDSKGRARVVKASIVAGYMRDGRFYTSRELSERPLDA